MPFWRYLLTTLVSLTGDVSKHAKTVLIRHAVTARMFSCGMSINYFSDSSKQ